MNEKAASAAPSEPPAHARLIQMATAYWVSRIVYAAAKLGLADHLSTGARTAAELAGLTRTDTRSLHRLMRTLAGLGILTEHEGGRFGLTPLGKALETGAPGSARASILCLAGQWWWRAWEELLYCLETGNTGMQKVFGRNIFEYLGEHPDEATYFNEAMIGFHGSEPSAVADAYDFSAFDTVVDVGGGTGNLLAAILERYPRVSGVVADVAQVVDEAAAALAARGLRDRVTFESIDFFKSVPRGGDVYVLSHVIHDWGEEDCLTILGNCRKAMGPKGRLLIVEMVLPPRNVPHPGKVLDITMLVIPGGEERTEEEYAELLGRAGLRLTKVVPTASPVGIVEAVPV
jgi:SAM-dependent methyltransferase